MPPPSQYPVLSAASDKAARTKIQKWADNFSMAYLPALVLPYFASSCDCNLRVCSALLSFIAAASLVKVFKVTPLVGPSVVKDDVTVSIALVKASVAFVERAGTRHFSAVNVGKKKGWSSVCPSSAEHPFGVHDAIDCCVDWIKYANDPERITCRQFYAEHGYATLYVPRRPELGLKKALLFRVNTDALHYLRAPAHALTTADEIKTHMKALATKFSGEVTAYNALPPSKKRTGGKANAFKQQALAIRHKKSPPLLRNPETLDSAASLVLEGALTAVVLAIDAGVEEPLPWLLPE